MNNAGGFIHDPLDEILESVWMLDEAGEDPTEERILEMSHTRTADGNFIDKLIEHDYLRREETGIVQFTTKGRNRARDIIRRHRLAERLLVDVLNIRENTAIESDACCFEHFLSPEVTDHICTLLGHPNKCPHSFDIPPGECCKRAQRQVETAVVPLGKLRAGESGRVIYISTGKHQRIDRLTSLGLMPGRVVKVHQREPLFILFLDETQLALDKSLVEDVYVVRS
jgi:DtxR family Mn-dependent transcriptional regulator